MHRAGRRRISQDRRDHARHGRGRAAPAERPGSRAGAPARSTSCRRATGRSTRSRSAPSSRGGGRGRRRLAPGRRGRDPRAAGRRGPRIRWRSRRLDPVADDGVADGLGDDEADPRPAGPHAASVDVEVRRRACGRPARRPRPDRATEVVAARSCGAAQASTGGTHRALGPSGRQLGAALAATAPRIARPARVRMRSRKPWVLARRRLFGWKVRLLTGDSGLDCCRDVEC